MSQLKVTQVKSTIGEKPAARETVRSLGLKRIGGQFGLLVHQGLLSQRIVSLEPP